MSDIHQRIQTRLAGRDITSVQLGVFVMALWFTSNGPAAYATCTSMFADPMTTCTTQVLGFIPVTVNLCHALCHFVSGLIGLVMALRRNWATAYAVGAGIYYIAWGLVGVAGGSEVRHHLGVDVFGTWVHVVEGSILLAIWIAFRSGRRSRS